VETRRGGRGEQDEHAAIPLAPDQPAERLPQPRPHHPIVMRGAAADRPPGGVQHGGTRPWYALHHHQPQRISGHVDPVAQRIRAEQRGTGIVAKDIHQGAGIDRIDVLGVKRQPLPRQSIGDAGVDRLQPLDGGEQPQRAAVRRLDQPGISAGQSGQIAALDIGDDQHLGQVRVIERAGRGESLHPGIKMDGAAARVGLLPALAARATAAQRGGGDDQAMRRLQHRLRKWSGGIEPAAVQADIIFAPLHPIDRQPVDEIGIGGAAEPGQHRNPRRQRLLPLGKPGMRALDPCAGGTVQPVRRVLDHRLQSLAQPRHRADHILQRTHRRGGRLDQGGIEFGSVGFQPVAGVLRAGAGEHRGAQRGEERFDRAER
jgi:hypothetical protein